MLSRWSNGLAKPGETPRGRRTSLYPARRWGVAGMHRLARGETIEKWFPLKSFRTGFNAARRRAGLEADRRRRVHDVRARFITEVSNSTKSTEVVRGAARHADYKTTQGYIEVAQEEMRLAIEAAELRRPERTANTAVNDPDTKSLTAVPYARTAPGLSREAKPDRSTT